LSEDEIAAARAELPYTFPGKFLSEYQCSKNDIIKIDNSYYTKLIG